MQQIDSLLQNLLFAQHVSGTFIPIVRSSRVIQMAAGCGTCLFGFRAPDDGHNGTGNMLSKK
jgi:hypothetical protein